MDAIRQYGMLSIGVSRMRDLNASGTPSSKRYVITNPPDDLKMYPSDRIFVLQQFDPGLEYTPTPAGEEDKYPLIRPLTTGNGSNHSLDHPPGNGSQLPKSDTNGTKPTNVPGQRDPNSQILLCSSLTDGPYSYIA